jgi:hypothetical protein
MDMRFFRLVPLGVLIVLPALGAPASTDPRADVIAGSSRCDGIPDNRTWLDCYYGAAQPLRAQLGLPPAACIATGACAARQTRGVGAGAPCRGGE